MTGVRGSLSIRRGYSLSIPPSHISKTIRLLFLKSEMINAQKKSTGEYLDNLVQK